MKNLLRSGPASTEFMQRIPMKSALEAHLGHSLKMGGQFTRKHLEGKSMECFSLPVSSANLSFRYVKTLDSKVR